MWHEPAGVVADEEELGAALRPFQGEGGRFWAVRSGMHGSMHRMFHGDQRRSVGHDHAKLLSASSRGAARPCVRCDVRAASSRQVGETQR